jgi:hypothetical protein
MPSSTSISAKARSISIQKLSTFCSSGHTQKKPGASRLFWILAQPSQRVSADFYKSVTLEGRGIIERLRCSSNT